MSSLKKKTQLEFTSPSKRIKLDNPVNILHKTLLDCGLELRNPPEKCVAHYETIHIILNLKRNLQSHIEFPRNVTEFCTVIEDQCKDLNVFKHLLFPNMQRNVDDNVDQYLINESVFKILLNVPILQNRLIDFIFEKALDLAAESKCGPWIQMILKCFSTLDCITNTDKISCNLLNLLDVASEKMVRIEIIIAFPDIIGDQQHNNIAKELSRILSEDYDLIPPILDCLSYLCLEAEQFKQLQQKTMDILASLTKCNFFPNFIKFLLMPGKTNENSYMETVLGIRNALGWSTSIATVHEIATSQVLTALAMRSSMLSSKVISNAWLKVVANCKESSEHKAIDFIILLILFSTSEEKQKQVENLIKKHIKLDILKENMLNETFEKFKPLLKEYLHHCIKLTNSLLNSKTDPLIIAFASHIYTLMLSQLEDCSQVVVAELLQLGLDCRQCVLNILQILNNVASTDMSILKPQSLQMLTLLDRTDEMALHEIKAVMNLICGLAYSFDNSLIKDDIHMIIRKELSSSSPIIKIEGILAGIYAVKFLIVTKSVEEHGVDTTENQSHSSSTHLAEGDLHEAVQIIELVSRSTRQFPDMIAFFYDELSRIIEPIENINKNFLAWMTDAVTSDLQQNFIVDSIEKEKINNIPLCMQYCLNADSEMDETIAINIAGLTLKDKEDININILSPLFQLVQILHSKQHHGDLSSIDALLGCAVVMPKFDIDDVEDMDSTTVSNITDCLLHCMNWFRELLNAFSSQTDEILKGKILNRITHVEQLEILLNQIITKSKVAYKAPSCTFSLSKYTRHNTELKATRGPINKHKNKKNNVYDDTIVTDTGRTQGTQNQAVLKTNLDVVLSLPIRPLNLNVLQLLKSDLSAEGDGNMLSINTLMFLLKCISPNIEKILISKIKRKTFWTKDESVSYDRNQAEECAKSVYDVLPKLLNHLNSMKAYLEENVLHNAQVDFEDLSMETTTYLNCMEKIIDFFIIYFKWIGFKNGHISLLKSSLRIFTTKDSSNHTISLKELVISVTKYLQTLEPYCLQSSTATSLIDFMNAIKCYSENNKIVTKILTEVTKRFLEKQWKSPDGLVEKGFTFNQRIDKILAIYFSNHEVIALKNLALQLTSEIQTLKNRNDVLNNFKCINKGNFLILFKRLGSALYECTKNRLNKGLTNSEHLSLWKDVALILKSMSEIAKTVDNRNNLAAIFKKSLPVLKLFLSQGIPILEIQFKNETQEVLEILKILQQSTRFLQSLCCHSRLKNDTVLLSKVPHMRQLLETLIYKVKALLAANNCSEAFWMGNLKNKDIHGEVIATQQSVASEESAEDCDEQLPDDDDSDDSDEEMINPDSRSVSDIV